MCSLVTESCVSLLPKSVHYCYQNLSTPDYRNLCTYRYRLQVSVRTINRDLLGMRYVQKIASMKDVSIQKDTTYWGRDFGLMVIKDVLRNRILWRKYVTHETISAYMEGISFLKSHGFRIYKVVTDGMRGLAQMLSPYPIQMCQFHQVLIVRRYLTQDPELEASRDLLALVNGITKKDGRSFASVFEDWYEKYQEVLNGGYRTGG